MKFQYCLFLLFLLTVHCKPRPESTVFEFPGKPEVPSSIMKEHKSLLDQVQSFTLFQDSTARVAKKLLELMQHHFQEEGNYVLPPLGLLPTLANGELPEASQDIIVLTEKFKSQFDHTSAEHQLIKAFVDEMVQAAKKEGHSEVLEFEKEIAKHAAIEDEILFPTALLIGEYLKLKSEK